ncbi:MAG: sigma 54-interacting transcriptional regulator, partial [Polyangiaceae bacterium]|nr:sigma 54-interacting transcriptional regulator [Polyangiaceae bacterium]
VGDVTARADFCRRWGRSIDVLPRESSGARLLRSADLSLRAGDVERAIEFARAAVAREGESCDALLALGRATTARGDLTTAAIVLGKAMAAAPDAASRARASVELAEVRYKSGEQADAKRLAAEALAAAPDLAARLGARNVLGKLLLASGAWAEAEEHFAADAWEAACGGDRVGELRAQLNRAIALLSSGRLDEARSMLHGVLEDGEACSELRASGLALSNLSVIALLKHEYLDAVRLAERALEVFRLMGEKATLAHLITNLAELRLQIGLVVEAEQALAFGRKVCGPVIPGTRAPHLSLVAAQIHLARGRTMDAAAEVSSAIASASGSSNGAKLGECYAVAARIALEDGHLARAEQAIARARAEASSARAQAEVALLEAMLARAGGAPFEAAAQRGLDLAREADDSERLREAHALLHVAAADAGDARAARYHLDAALARRDRVSASLPEELRLRFLARRDVEALARLEAQARRDADAARPCELCGEAGCRACGRPSAPSLPSRRAADSMFGAPGRAAEPRVPCAPGLAAPASSRIIGRDAAVRALLSLIQKVGASDATVLIHGESGTGKELVAEAIHEASPRRHGPLVKVNCSALVETLLLSELFGHEKGSFTGAAARRRGRFEVAEGGTIFLDEIGDISPRTQVALLRVLEDRTFERVGGVTPLRANVRILCATHRDLRAMVARGEFREDLYYRLRQVVLEVPALRQRIGDLPQIAAAILARIAADLGTAPKRLSGRAATALSRHAWPGNVRELENALRAAALFAEGETIEVEHFASNVDGFEWLAASEPTPSDPGRPPSSAPSARGSAPPASGAGAADDGDRRTPVEVAYAQVRAGTSLSDMKREIERECIARALEESRGNITRAAALLGMKRPRLSQLVKQYGFGGVSED